MQKFMCMHSVPKDGFTAEQIGQLAEALQHERDIRGYFSFFNLSQGKACCVLEATDRDAIAQWFKEKGVPYDEILPVELEGERGVIRDLRPQPAMAGIV